MSSETQRDAQVATIAKNISDGWNSSLSYMSAIGIGGIITGEVGRRIARVIDGNERADVRRDAALQAAKVVGPIADACEELHDLTGIGHDHGERAYFYLRALFDALGDLTATLHSNAKPMLAEVAGN